MNESELLFTRQIFLKRPERLFCKRLGDRMAAAHAQGTLQTVRGADGIVAYLGFAPDEGAQVLDFDAGHVNGRQAAILQMPGKLAAVGAIALFHAFLPSRGDVRWIDHNVPYAGGDQFPVCTEAGKTGFIDAVDLGADEGPLQPANHTRDIGVHPARLEFHAVCTNANLPTFAVYVKSAVDFLAGEGNCITLVHG